MKTNRKWMAVLLSLVLFIAAVSVNIASFAASAETSGDFEYRVLSDNTAELTDYTGTGGDVVIPANIDGYSIVRIGFSAFSFSNIVSVTIPDSVTSIESQAFIYCSQLSSIAFGDNVTDIGSEAFEGTSYCQNEENWEDGVLYLGNCLIKANDTVPAVYVIKDGTKIIADDAFRYCDNLTNVTMPNSLFSIGDTAFFDCEQLLEIVLSSALDYVGGSAFKNTPWLSAQPSGPLYIGKTLYGYIGDMPSNTSIEVKEGIKHIASDAFYFECNLDQVSLPESIVSIGYSAFSQSSLRSINIPSGVSEIERETFAATNLTEIALPESVHTIGTNAFSSNALLKKIVLSEGLKEIQGQAFSHCTSLSEINFPSTLEYVASSAFIGTEWFYMQPAGCFYTGPILFRYIGAMPENYQLQVREGTKSIALGALGEQQNLTSVVFPNSLTTIEDSAFIGCSGLSTVEIPDSVTYIGQEAFRDCTALTTVVLPNNVTTIDYDAFNGCTSLVSVYYSGSQEQWGTILIEEGNEPLKNAELIFVDIPSSIPSTEPSTEPVVDPSTDPEPTEPEPEPTIPAPSDADSPVLTPVENSCITINEAEKIAEIAAGLDAAALTAELCNVNTMFCGVMLDAGEHTVEFRYTTPHWLLAVALSGAGLVMLLVVALYWKIKSKKSKSIAKNLPSDPRQETERVGGASAAAAPPEPIAPQEDASAGDFPQF